MGGARLIFGLGSCEGSGGRLVIGELVICTSLEWLIDGLIIGAT
jgi:hypothetical protein